LKLKTDLKISEREEALLRMIGHGNLSQGIGIACESVSTGKRDYLDTIRARIEGRDKEYLDAVRRKVERSKRENAGYCEECGHVLSLDEVEAWPDREACPHCNKSGRAFINE